jgi:hypothetical protein
MLASRQPQLSFRFGQDTYGVNLIFRGGIPVMSFSYAWVPCQYGQRTARN